MGGQGARIALGVGYALNTNQFLEELPMNTPKLDCVVEEPRTD